MAYKKSIDTKMNDLGLCLAVVSGHVIGLRRLCPDNIYRFCNWTSVYVAKR